MPQNCLLKSQKAVRVLRFQALPRQTVRLQTLRFGIMPTKNTFPLLILATFTGLLACKKPAAPTSSADTYRSMLPGSWSITQRGIDQDGDGFGEETEISALPPTLFSLMNFHEDATGMVYILDNSSHTPMDTAIHFTWNIPPDHKGIQLVLDGRQEVFTKILKLTKVQLVLEYENQTGTKEWVYLTKP